MANEAYFNIQFSRLFITKWDLTSPLGTFRHLIFFSFNLEKIPLWLISFISIFFPICFTTHVVDCK